MKRGTCRDRERLGKKNGIGKSTLTVPRPDPIEERARARLVLAGRRCGSPAGGEERKEAVAGGGRGGGVVGVGGGDLGRWGGGAVWRRRRGPAGGPAAARGCAGREVRRRWARANPWASAGATNGGVLEEFYSRRTVKGVP